MVWVLMPWSPAGKGDGATSRDAGEACVREMIGLRYAVAAAAGTSLK
ncbi:hypothetical protein GCM10027290_29310 [Micromonospora sonneratiae]